ncbi:MAG: extracellular solute-binding protein [Lachnospirales bacterium]
MKKFISISISVMLFLVGCGNTGQQATSNSQKIESTENLESNNEVRNGDSVDLSVMIYDRANAPDGVGSASNNRWTEHVARKMKENYNVTLSYMSVPRSEEGTKVPVMIASQTAADVMITYDRNMVMDFYEDGGIHDLSSSIEDYGQDLVEYLTQDCLNEGKNENGDQVLVNARRTTTTVSNYLVRQDWLDKLGLEVPKTPMDLYNVLKEFKEKDPSGVGSENIVPAFFADDGERNISRAFYNNMQDEKIRFITDNNKLMWRSLVDPEGALEFFKYYNKLYNEGLIDKEYFVDAGGASREEEWFVTNKLGFLEANVNFNVDPPRGVPLMTLKEIEPTAEFIAIPPLKNIHDNEAYNAAYPITGLGIFSPKTNKNPDAAIQYLNLLAGNTGFEIYNGFEGEHYEFDEDNVAVPIDPQFNAKDKDWIRFDLFILGSPGYFKTEDEYVIATSKEDPLTEKYVIDNYAYASEGIRQGDFNYSSPTQRERGVDVSNIFNAYKVDISTTTPDNVENLFNEMIIKLEASPAPMVIKEREEYYDTYIGE